MHQVFPGNTADINAFRLALKEPRQRFSLRRAIMVADRGMVSEDILHGLERANQEGQEKKIDYILGMRLRKSKEIREEVLRRAGRYHPLW